MRGDATNSAAAQRTKVHFCAVTSTYYCSMTGDDVDGEDEGDMQMFATAPRIRTRIVPGPMSHPMGPMIKTIYVMKFTV